MKKILYLCTALLAVVGSSPLSAEDNSAMLRQQIEQSMQEDCNNPAFAGCLGISSQTCLSAGQKMLDRCASKMPKGNIMENIAAMEAFDQCVETYFSKFAGISVKRFHACDAQAGDGTNPPPAGMNSAPDMAMLQQMMQQQAQNVGTAGVTLPLYKKASVMMHITDGKDMAMFVEQGITPLPALTMASPDNIKTIAAFYRKKLAGFTEYNLNGDILFLEKGPKNFDMLRDMKRFVTTPHVYLSSLNGDEMMIPPGSKTQIEIAYRK
ncbi:MAG: hypothetical protein OEZ39_02160 [Gammaproteobacteria bacterium]|nr:hypothetical protein [Gammaproteobacteria bacterium]MDH5650658.1 hypothetical protein [Gammaproteobacteria bacterium]